MNPDQRSLECRRRKLDYDGELFFTHRREALSGVVYEQVLGKWRTEVSYRSRTFFCRSAKNDSMAALSAALGSSRHGVPARRELKERAGIIGDYHKGDYRKMAR